MTFSQIRQYIKGLLSNIFNKSLSNIAPKFDKTKTYAIGDRVIYNGDLYQFTSAHTGAWVAADANKTDINTLTERMPSNDMEEVASPLPGVMSRRMKYNLQEQVVGEWIDGRPVYQKVITKDHQQMPVNTETIVVNTTDLLDKDDIEVIDFHGVYYADKGKAEEGKAEEQLHQFTGRTGDYGYSAYYRQADNAIKVYGGWGNLTYTIDNLIFYFKYVKKSDL